MSETYAPIRTGNHKKPDQIATREKINQGFQLIFNSLPDPDIILRKLGRSYSALREVMTDDQFETAWSSRLSALTKPDYFIESGADDAQAKKAAEFAADVFKSFKMRDILTNLAEYSLFGFVAAEIVWVSRDGYWIPTDIVSKPQEWFAFNNDNELVLRRTLSKVEQLPPNRFLLLQHRSSYMNPYGQKLLSKIYWPYIFRKNGAQWWATFTEKFGAAFATAKHRPGAPEGEINDIIHMLEDLVACGVATFPEGTDIEIITDTNKAAATSNFKDFESFFNASITKVILGATLTTDIGDVGSKSAATVHNSVREDIAMADRDTIRDAFNQLLAVMTWANFGENVASPVFKWQEKEDLQIERLDRDTKLYSIGFRPSKKYIAETYHINQDLFSITEEKAGDIFEKETGKSDFSLIEDDLETEQTFNQQHFASGQKVVNAIIEDYQKALQKAQTYDQAVDLLISKYSKHKKHREQFAQVLDNVRYVASQIGCDGAANR